MAASPACSLPLSSRSFARQPITDYGRKKVEIEAFLHAKHRAEGFPATVIHPGHISGRKWLPIDPQGSRDGVGVYEKLATGKDVYLPDQGTATLHHVHGDDVARLFELALENPEPAMGESFSAVTPYALSLRGCCRAVAAMFGRASTRLGVRAIHTRHFEAYETHPVNDDDHRPDATIAELGELRGLLLA